MERELIVVRGSWLLRFCVGVMSKLSVNETFRALVALGWITAGELAASEGVRDL